MKKNLLKKDPLFNSLKKGLLELPVCSNVSSFWNFGLLLGLTLLFQIVTGLLLSLHYVADVEVAFGCVNSHICRDVWYGWMIRSYHANAAGLFLVCMYVHIGRSIYLGSYMNFKAWVVGVLMMVLLMAIAFLGYVLVWGQMSYWAATVITNLFTAVPYVGEEITFFIWGDYSVSSATLKRFFSLHLALPLLLVALSVCHIIYIHEKGSTNPLGVNGNSIKVPLHQYFTVKDFFFLAIYLMVLSFLVFFFPNIMSDPENFIMADPLITPAHIKPELYFLWAYAILRSVPSKLGGVSLMFTAIFCLLLMPLLNRKVPGCTFSPFSQVFFWCWVCNFFFLSYLGACPVACPYETLGSLSTFFYFFYFFADPLMKKYISKFSGHQSGMGGLRGSKGLHKSSYKSL